ncbi:endo alpha-1,4 polygalactosaminidase [Pseudonocardia sp. ICBG162]|uniref:endo alpha-1,4 polygalactosaminidase n=1 Tax=Pseudonocardia sp. ICBG162 TaxID=2846761 RepID=UPI001CF64837|nr:endo alpha-1,4 polygalactosaminidase [Pseudonocardia sp. ICBG162]
MTGGVDGHGRALALCLPFALCRRLALCGALAVAAVLLAGCATVPTPGAPDPGAVDTSAPAGATGLRRAFPAGAGADYQLGGAYPPPPGTGIVVRDSTADPAPGTWSVCYVNAFQTQPQDRERWLREHPDLVLRGGDREPVADPGWPDELLLDISTPQRRAGVAEVVTRVVDRCAAAGFDAVELDNLDSWTRSGGAFTADDAEALAVDLAGVVHARGLAVGQKNATDLLDRLPARGYDFAVAEECVAFDECGAFTAAYGDRVLDVEYVDGPDADPAACGDPGRRPRTTVVRDRLLVPAGDPGYVHRAC